MTSAVYMLILEVLKVFDLGKNYFLVWNMVHLISCILNITVTLLDLFSILDMRHGNDLLITSFFSFAMFMMYLKLFYFMRIFKKHANMVRMIIEITKDMKSFLFLMLLAIIGLGHWAYLFAAKIAPDSIGNSMFIALIWSFKQGLGDFEHTQNYEEENGAIMAIMFTVFTLGCVLIPVILLNLLIAIMGDTYDKVTESGENAIYLERV